MAEKPLKSRRDVRAVAMGVSLAAAFLMLAGKLVAYRLTGSDAILSDAVESVVHLGAVGLAALSLWYAHQDACGRHPYGHGKAAYFSAGFEGALICSAALYIGFSATKSLMSGPEFQDLGWGLLITAALAAVNGVLGFYLVYVGRRHNAVVLVANGKHVLTDMWTSVGVLIGVALVWATGLAWLDPLVAIAVGLHIFINACRLMVRAYQGLLDQADPEKTQAILDTLNAAIEEGRIMGFHQLRHREANDAVWVEMHILVPGSIDVAEAHSRVTAIERRLREAFPRYQVTVTSHIEPARHDRAHPAGHNGLDDPFAGAEKIPPSTT